LRLGLLQRIMLPPPATAAQGCWHIAEGDLTVTDRVARELQQARQSLMDMTMRNRLLHFRPTLRTTIRIIDELPAELWRLLVQDGKKMAFLAREEHKLFDGPPLTDHTGDDDVEPLTSLEDMANGADVDFTQPGVETALEPGQALPSRYIDLFLQTALSDKDLQTNLLRIDQRAASALAERGVNLLFLAMGFLAWKQDGREDKTFRAPLILLPVGLERTSARRRFKLTALDDDPVLNPCLARMLTGFGIDMPPASESWEDFDVAGHLGLVREAVSQRPDWEVKDDIYLGFFSFAKYLMYLDLDPERWQGADDDRPPVAENPMVRALCGDEGAWADDAGDIPHGQDLDDRGKPEDTFQVVDADSSQLEAILLAKKGASLVIQGPPGTGKSQTITNIIAELLGEGKTVLFVSEKMVALEVVKRRLDDVGLGDFCLELHSTKANRRSVAEELGRVLERGPVTVASRGVDAQKLLRVRDRLNAYVRAVHQPFGAAGITPYQAMGKVALLADVPDVVCDMPGHAAWDTAQLGGLKDSIEYLSQQMGQVWPLAEHPWKGCRLQSVTGEIRRSVETATEGVASTLRDMTDAASECVALLGAQAPTTWKSCLGLLQSVKLVLSSPGPEQRVLEDTSWRDPPAEMAEYLTTLNSYVEALAWLHDRYDPDIAISDHGRQDRRSRHGRDRNGDSLRGHREERRWPPDLQRGSLRRMNSPD